MPLRPELVAIVDALLEDKAPKSPIELDSIGEAIGARAVSSDEIDAMLTLIEKRGHKTVTRAGGRGGRGEATLKTVLTTARALKIELGRVPTPSEVAEKSSLPLIDVHHALSLARIMQR